MQDITKVNEINSSDAGRRRGGGVERPRVPLVLRGQAAPGRGAGPAPGRGRGGRAVAPLPHRRGHRSPRRARPVREATDRVGVRK